MNSSVQYSLSSDRDIFAIATQMYVRLRRVSGRVMDVSYLVENHNYAQYIIDLALGTQDAELERYALRLKNLIQPEHEQAVQQQEYLSVDTATSAESNEDQISEEEVFKAQVPHHYIGALR
ncbi:hypothetical protein [Acinetobacter populi]|uniref:Uncharacterized protein n=1 Tax=Acinetobacter populi TaxID=1582270 RepID=A0A1Z9YY52_9GAMM|nr:hypothetical protein [Acinetobacter populi]OUY07151.1 hypothetical protein CAP51_10725 [Acinetobacter populi]